MNILDASNDGGKVMVGGKAVAKSDKSANVAKLGIRPEHMTSTTKSKAKVYGVVRHTEHLGEYALGYVDLSNGATLTVKLEDEQSLSAGDEIHLTFDDVRVHLFDNTGKIIR